MRDQGWRKQADLSRRSVSQGHVAPLVTKPRGARVDLGEMADRIRALSRNPVYLNDGTVTLLWQWYDAGEYARVGWWLDHGQRPVKERARFLGPRASITSIRKRGR